MDIRDLESFIAVAEELHFGRAADRVFVGQSQLSRTIRRLELELGASLFERNTRSVTLTSAGQALLQPAHAVLIAMFRAQESVRGAIAGEVGELRIESSGFAAHSIVANLTRRVRMKHPGVVLQLSSQPISRPSMAKLAGREIDLALGRWDYFPPGIASTLLLEDSLVFALPRGHRYALASSISYVQLREEVFISLPHVDGSITTDRLWRLAYLFGKGVQVAQFAPDTDSCLALVSAGVGCHLTLHSVSQAMATHDVSFVPLVATDAEQLPDVHLRAAWRQDDDSPTLTVVLDAMPRPAARDRAPA